ncbi:hydrolase [Weizmannia acidilactici]|uniref:MBL fold metallo-hydrolase n=1 Tax=Weizmannia acidilactici TaxID=2607726 RepID=UPI00124DEBF4|nr:MBL fold metallo-hydrolase [Weizmannia acidilactici]GER68546.1 hydrolase [Weizmannia acidilactici]
MIIADGVAMLEVEKNNFKIHPTLIWDENQAVLVDTGMPGSLDAIREEMGKAGVPFEKLTTVILTHQDLDHIGSLPEILRASAKNITVYAHQMDKPYIEGERHLIKADPKKMDPARWEAMPEEMKNIYLNPPKAKVDVLLEEGEVLLFGGGIEVIFTPGHTPGHCSLYVRKSKTLITGDAMVSEGGKLQGPRPQMTPDMETATDSLKKFLDYDIETVVCYHGGLCDRNVNEQIRKLAE